MEHPDQKYIEALLNNNPVLLDELYQKYSGKIKWMVLQNKGTEADAVDIFQEALLSIYHKARTKSFVLTCPLDAFLYLICKNKWLNELSKRKNRPVTIIDDDGYNLGEDSFKLAEDCTLQEERFKLLSEKLEELGDACKELLRLSWSGRTMEEVAVKLGFTYGYARKKKTECMAKLVKLIKQSSKFSVLKW
jgi:RNA polymerase sigma factor (sigma-70 family)